jgi:hypothetical protein
LFSRVGCVLQGSGSVTWPMCSSGTARTYTTHQFGCCCCVGAPSVDRAHERKPDRQLRLGGDREWRLPAPPEPRVRVSSLPPRGGALVCPLPPHPIRRIARPPARSAASPARRATPCPPLPPPNGRAPREGGTRPQLAPRPAGAPRMCISCLWQTRVRWACPLFRCVPLCTAVYRCVPLCTAVYHCVPLCTAVYRCVYRCVPLCTAVYRCVPLCTAVYRCVPLCTAVCTAVHRCVPLCGPCCPCTAPCKAR